MNWELIGKLGGGGVEVQKVPVDIVADGYSNTEVVTHTVYVPEGETWLVVLSGDLDPQYTASGAGPELRIGEVTFGSGLPQGRVGAAAEVTGTAEIALKRMNGAGTDRFSGHVYTVPLPA